MSEAAPHTVAHSHTPAQSPRLEAESLWRNPLAYELRGSGERRVEQRNAWLDQTLDGNPRLPLPAISLEPVEEASFSWEVPYTTTTNFNVLSPTKQKVGHIVLRQPTEPAYYGDSDKHFIGNILIFEDARYRGYGPAAYLAVLKSLPQGAGLRTEGVLTNDAKRIWNNLVSKGVARQTGSEARPPTAYETVF